ncbi:MAG: 4Fe-4S dicluster domain-containing protein [Ndongobacter sp.]|nr:4Fe-4S dicluster domain-containing protein [Ndongobacter sp.]
MNSSFVDVINIRRQVFANIARMAYEDADLGKLHEETFRLLPGETASYRENIFRERAVVGERMRMALGLDARTAAETGPITEGIEHVDVDARVYHPPLVSVIKIACEACPEKHIYITDNCRKCLAHPCINVCPKNAITMGKDRAIIDQSKCIKCRKCVTACPYHSIVETGRPCAEACGVQAIKSDYLGRAEIDPQRCVACGACITACPFGAVADKSQIYQLIMSIKRNDNVYAIVAPSFAGQFGPLTTPEQIVMAIKLLGIHDVIEVGLGADLTTMNEAKEFLETVPEERPFMGTSCCFSWKKMVEMLFPDQNELISESSTPMIYTAKQIKKVHPDAKVVFIGPCISKKLEALQAHVAPFVDFVITYEELMGMFVAEDIEPGFMPVSGNVEDASLTGRGYAVSGGVAAAVCARIAELEPERRVEVEGAEGLAECVSLMRLAKAGKKNGMLLEGMACAGGCVGGPGTIAPSSRSKREVEKFAKRSPFLSPADNTRIPDADKPL